MEDHPLRVTDTNSAKDFSGLILGIEVPLFRWIILSFVAGLGVFTLLQNNQGMEIETKVIVALVPVAATTCFILFFCQGKPSGHFLDSLDAWITAGDASPLNRFPARHHDEPFS